MRLYNKGFRSFIINKVDAIDGCRFLDDEVGKDRAYIDPDKTVEIKDEIGVKLLADYPKELMKIRDGEPSKKESKEESKEKESKKKSKKAKKSKKR